MSAETGAQLLKPATTPGSTQDEERCLTEPLRPGQLYRQRWRSPAWHLVPCYMVVVSIVQVLTYLLADDETSRLLRLEPSLRWQAWRYATYMLAHWGRLHLALNVTIQCMLAVSLEVEQGGARSLLVYLLGGLLGGLSAALLQPQPMVGASAGVYALLTSHLAHLYLNFYSVKYKFFRIFAVCVLAGSDIAFCIFHTSTAGHPSISLSAHASGGLAGVLVGLVAYNITHPSEKKDHRRVVFWVALVLTAAVFGASAVLVAVLPQTYFRR